MIARSTLPAASHSATSPLKPSRTCSLISGYCSDNATTIRRSSTALTEGGRPRVTSPLGDSRKAWMSRSATSRRLSTSRAWTRKLIPAAVSVTPRPLRYRTAAPSRSSSARICRLSAGCAMPRVLAARENEPRSATSTKYLIWRSSIGQPRGPRAARYGSASRSATGGVPVAARASRASPAPRPCTDWSRAPAGRRNARACRSPAGWACRCP